jgi:hypothetical protein
MQNYNYIVLSPQKKEKPKKEPKEAMIDKENLKFKIDPRHKSVTTHKDVKKDDKNTT